MATLWFALAARGRGLLYQCSGEHGFHLFASDSNCHVFGRTEPLPVAQILRDRSFFLFGQLAQSYAHHSDLRLSLIAFKCDQRR
jgi:hypothetical protein